MNILIYIKQSGTGLLWGGIHDKRFEGELFTEGIAGILVKGRFENRSEIQTRAFSWNNIHNYLITDFELPESEYRDIKIYLNESGTGELWGGFDDQVFIGKMVKETQQYIQAYGIFSGEKEEQCRVFPWLSINNIIDLNE